MPKRTWKNAWYEERCPGLGSRFLDEFERSMERVLHDPLAFMEMLPDVRRIVLHTFPYSAFYTLRHDMVVVLAVFHGHRSPRKVRKRVIEE